MKLIMWLKCSRRKWERGTWAHGTMPAEALKAIAGTLIIGCTGALVFYVRKFVNNYEENERAKKELLLSNSAEKDKRDEEYMVLLKESMHLQQGMKQHLYWMDTRLHNMDPTTPTTFLSLF